MKTTVDTRFEAAYEALMAKQIRESKGERKRKLQKGLEHAQKLFLEKVWWPAFGNLYNLSPEFEIRDFKDVKGGKRGRVDLLVETRLKGENAIILIHLEPQSYYEKEFAERMFLYTCKLFEKYRCRIVPIAIFSHKRKMVEPNRFSWRLPFLEVLQFRYYS